MEELERREGCRCRAHITCPDCWCEHVPQPDRTGGLMSCLSCGRVFSYVREENVEHVTVGLGLCPVCNKLVEPTRSGKVPRYHHAEQGKVCKGVGRPALRQLECPAPAAE